jgi:hypothetical protein
MLLKKKMLTVLALSLFVSTLSPAAIAKPTEYDLVIRHLKTKYKAKKVGIPFMSLARAIVAVARPAGVKAFKITVFKGLQFSRENLDREMQAALRETFSAEWIPILRIRSREGQQAYMYMRESGQDIKINLVTIDKENAAVIRATFNPDKLIEFMNNPKVFGISLGDDKPDKPKDDKPTPQPETAAAPPETPPSNQ